MTTSVRAGRRLSLAKVAVGAFVYAWQLRAGILRQAGLAMAAQVLLILLWTMVDVRLSAGAGWMLYGFYVALTAIVAVRCHRLALLSGTERDQIAMPLLEMRELKFLLVMLIVWVPAIAVMNFASFVLQVGYQIVTHEGAQADWLRWLAWVPAGYVAGRLSLKLPAVAIDHPMDIASVLLATRSNGWRMCFVIALIPWLIAMLGNNLYVDDAGPAAMLTWCVVMQLLVAVEVIALSLAYRELVGNRGDAIEAGSVTPSS